MPVGVRGFMIAALLAAAMSTMDSVLHVLSTISVVNIYQKYINPNATDDRNLRWARRMIIVWGVVIIFTAVAMRDLKSILVAANSLIALFVGPMMGVFLIGMFSNRVNWQGALMAVAAGTLVGYLLKFHSTHIYYSGAATLVTVLVVGRLASEFFPAPRPENLQGLTWKWRGWKEMLLGDPLE